MPEEACPQKAQLLAHYERAALEYVNAATELQRQMEGLEGLEGLPKDQYHKFYSRLEFLQALVSKAKANYDSHVREHGC
jgi:hypothetical protein